MIIFLGRVFFLTFLYRDNYAFLKLFRNIFKFYDTIEKSA